MPPAQLSDAIGLVEQIAAGDRTAAAVLEQHLDRIDRLDPQLRAMSVVLADEARAEAAARDAELARGRARGPPHGVPVAVEEELDVAGCVTTLGGRGHPTPALAHGELVPRPRPPG